jgi:hypothetical protein
VKAVEMNGRNYRAVQPLVFCHTSLTDRLCVSRDMCPEAVNA